MRIIKRTEFPETQITCDACKSILAYTALDEKTKVEDFCEELHDWSYIKCPVCKSKITTRIDGEKI